MTGLNDFRNHPCNTPIGTTFCVRYNCDGEHRGPVAEAHSRLLDLVLGRKYSGDTMQTAIRQLIAVAQVEERNRVEASGRDAADRDTARLNWILDHTIEEFAHLVLNADGVREAIDAEIRAARSTPAPKGEDRR